MIDTSWLGALDQAFCLRFVQALLHFLWQGAVVGVFVRVLARSSASCRVRYATSVACLLLMVACIPVTYLLFPNPPRVISEVDTNQPARMHVGDDIRLDSSVADVLSAVSEPLADATDVDVRHEGNSGTFDSGPVEDIGSDKPQLLGSLAPFAMVMYLVGVAIMLLRVVFGLCSAYRLQRLATPVTEPNLLGVLLYSDN